MRALAAVAVVGAALAAGLVSAPARAAGPCDDAAFGRPTGPVPAGILEGELGRAHRVCGRSEVGLDVGGQLLVDRPAFYGRLAAAVRVDGSWAFTPRGELFGSFEAFRYDSVIAPLADSAAGIGHLSVGAAYRFLDAHSASLGVNGKVVLPTAAPLYRHVWPVGIDLGLAAQLRAHRVVQFHLQAGALTSVGLGKGPPLARVGAAVTGGIEVLPAPQFGFAVDLHAGFGYAAPVDVVAAALALRFSDGRRFGFEIAADVPLLGRERTAVRIDLKATVRLGPILAAIPAP